MRQAVDAIVEHFVVAQDPGWTPAILWIHDELMQRQGPTVSEMLTYGSDDVGRAFQAWARHVCEKSSLAILLMFCAILDALRVLGPASAGERYKLLLLLSY